MTLPPLSDVAWPPALADMAGGFATQLNVYRTMAHHPALLRAWAPLRDHLVIRCALASRDKEVVVLRCAYRAGAPYEWAHHVVRGRAAGLSDDEIRALAEAEPSGDLDARDRLLARAVDALVERRRLPGDLADALLHAFGPAGVMDLIGTVGMYLTLAFIVNSFDTPIEPDIAAEAAGLPIG